MTTLVRVRIERRKYTESAVSVGAQNGARYQTEGEKSQKRWILAWIEAADPVEMAIKQSELHEEPRLGLLLGRR